VCKPQWVPSSAPWKPLYHRYEAQRVVHTSPLGRIVLARDMTSDRAVVVKVGRKTSRGPERPLQEARTLAKLQCVPGVVRMVEARENNEHIIMVMEYLPHDLFEVIHHFNGLGESSARHVFARVAKCLANVHSLNVAHLDVSPENILMDRNAESVRLCDFGASIEVKANKKTIRHVVAGKLNYMAPEMLFPANKAADKSSFNPFKADAYSLGATLFCMVFGHQAYDLGDKKIGKVAFGLATGGAQGVRSLLNEYGHRQASKEVVDLIGRLMIKDPEMRMSVSEVLDHPWITEGGGGLKASSEGGMNVDTKKR